MKSIIEGCFERPGAVILALVLIFFSGINAFLSIPKEASPDVEIPVAYVSVAYEGISPSDAEKLLTKPLEKQLKTVAGLKKMTSAATEGYTSITVEFDAGEDIDLVIEDVRQAVDDAKNDLPKNVNEDLLIVFYSVDFEEDFWRKISERMLKKTLIIGNAFILV